MPTYEYVCKKCGAHLDIFHSMKDAALKICPKDKCPKKDWGKGTYRDWEKIGRASCRERVYVLV